MLSIFVVSDGSGKTAERMLRAALAQFEDASPRVLQRRNVRTQAQVREVVEEAAGQKSLVVHTLVSNGLRQLMLSEARAHDVDALDMLGPLLDRLTVQLGLTPQERPGLIEQLVEARSREIEAVEFAFHHDDGRHMEDLGRAEIVLVGVSRSKKTPTMLYLAYRGWFAANVPLIPEMDPPPALLAVPPQRVFYLAMAPSRLAELRRVRARNDAIPVEPYASLSQVKKELFHGQELCRKHHWQCLDVTGKSVEEAAREIIALVPGENPHDG